MPWRLLACRGLLVASLRLADGLFGHGRAGPSDDLRRFLLQCLVDLEEVPDLGEEVRSEMRQVGKLLDGY